MHSIKYIFEHFWRICVCVFVSGIEMKFLALSAVVGLIRIINEEMHLQNSIDEPLKHFTHFPRLLINLPFTRNAALSFLLNSNRICLRSSPASS